MALKLKTVSSTIGMKVYTEGAYYVGEVTEALVKNNKIVAWKVELGEGSIARKITAKGIVVDQAMVRSIGDIMIISDIDISEPSSQQT